MLIIRGSKLYYTASGIITPIWNKLIVKQIFCASSWLITELNILRCTVSKTSNFLSRRSLSRDQGLALTPFIIPALLSTTIFGFLAFVDLTLCRGRDRLSGSSRKILVLKLTLILTWHSTYCQVGCCWLTYWNCVINLKATRYQTFLGPIRSCKWNWNIYIYIYQGWKILNIWAQFQQIKIILRKKLRADWCQEMLPSIRRRIFCLPVYY